MVYPALTIKIDEARNKLNQLKSKWKIIDGQKLQRDFIFENFVEAMVFTNEIAAIADDVGHYPRLKIHRQTVTVQLSTPAIKGLSEKDFILAGKIENCC